MSNEYLTHVSLGHLDHCVIEWTPCNVIYTAEIRGFVQVIFKCAESKKAKEKRVAFCEELVIL